MTEPQLVLLQFAARGSAQLRAAQVVRSDARNAGSSPVLLQELPDHLFAQPHALHLTSPAHRAQNLALHKASCRSPASIAPLTHVGMGIVRTRPYLPTRSMMHQRL